MTTAERLVQSMAKEKLAAITVGLRSEVDAVHDSTTLSKAPSDVRQAVLLLRRLQPQVVKAERVLRDHGYELRSDGSLRRDHRETQSHQQRVSERHRERLAAVAKLRDTALISLTGLKTGAIAAQPILQKFQAELAKL